MSSAEEQVETNNEKLTMTFLHAAEITELASESFQRFSEALFDAMPAEVLTAEMNVDVQENPFSLN